MENLKEKLLIGLTPIEEKLVHINIVTDYRWGFGWTEAQARNFQDEVFSKLRDAGYEIEKPKETYSAYILRMPNLMDHTSLHLHPMDFSGYARIEDISKIIGVLKTCKCVYEIATPKCKDVYNLTDKEYKETLSKYSNDILEWVKTYKEKGLPMYDIGFSFAQNYRIPRLGNSSECYSSGDADIEFIENAVIIFEGLGLL